MSSFVRRRYIRSITKSLLIDLNVHQPPVKLDIVLEHFGIELIEQPGDDFLSGFLLRGQNSERPLIGVNAKHPPTRRRFTIAHEVGHFLLHEGEMHHVDNEQEQRELRINRRDQKSSSGIDIKEREANFFSAELLMPEHFINQKLEEKDIHLLDDGKLREMSEVFLVSIQALTFRLSNLGYIRTW